MQPTLKKKTLCVCVHVCVHVHVEMKYEKTHLEKCLKLVTCKVKNYFKIIFQVLDIDQLPNDLHIIKNLNAGYILKFFKVL